MDVIVCGTYPRSKVEASGGDCPVCGAAGTVDVMKSYERCCVCFIPLCKVGGERHAARCSACGSAMPPSVVYQATARRRLAEAEAAGLLGGGGAAAPAAVFPGRGRTLGGGASSAGAPVPYPRPGK